MANRFVGKLARLADLGADDIGVLEAATAKALQFPKHRDLIRDGDRPGLSFVVLEGWAFRYKILPDGTRQILAFLMPGDACDLHVGHLAAMDHSIQTAVPSLVATINPEVIDVIMARHPEIRKAIYIAQLIDERTMRAWITSMGRRSSIQRVAHLMCELYVRAANIGLAINNTVLFPLSQLLLADALGMTSVHLNRILRELRLLGIMEISRGSLTIVDPPALVKIAGFDETYLHRRHCVS